MVGECVAQFFSRKFVLESREIKGGQMRFGMAKVRSPHIDLESPLERALFIFFRTKVPLSKMTRAVARFVKDFG